MHTLVLRLLLSATWIDGAGQTPVDSAPLAAQSIREAEIPASAERVVLQIADASAPLTLVQLSIAGQPLTLELRPHSLRSADFEVWTHDADGELRRMAQPPTCKTYRGRVREWPCSSVSATLSNGRLTALLRTLDHGDWIVQPSSARGGAAHVVFGADAQPLAVGSCGVSAEQEALARGLRDARPKPQAPVLRGGLSDTEVSFDADFEFYQLNGSSVDATVDDIEAVMNSVDAIYRSEVAISYVVNRIIVRTAEPDPYTSTNRDVLLDQFSSHWSAAHSGQERDIAHLMTGKDIDGSTIGYASIGVVCTSNAYGFSQSRFSTNFALRVAVTAHELGHNWDATHCDASSSCAIMCATISGCSGVVNQFSAGEEAEIVSYRDSVGCLGGFDSTVYVDDSNNTGSEDGSPAAPYNTLREGLWATSPGGTIVLLPGNYDFERTAQILNRPVRLTKQSGGGSALIGQ